MWAEAYHSSSDTVNQILLLLGIKISKKPATFLHPFGFGKSQFFWSFVVATMIFGISGVLALEQGISSLLHEGGHHTENHTINYIVLAIAAGFEGNALRIAFAQFKGEIKKRGNKVTIKTLLSEFKESKDPTILTVVVEDSAALLGIGIASAGILLTDITGNSVYDAIGSLAIGVLLMMFAFFLAKENRGLLIGESVSELTYNKIIDTINDIPEVHKVITMKTMHLSPHQILVGIEVNLIDELNTDQIESIIDIIEQRFLK